MAGERSLSEKILLGYDEDKQEILYPGGRYLQEFVGPRYRKVDEIAWRILYAMSSFDDLKVERLRDVVEISAGGINGIVVHVTDHIVEIRQVEFEWHSHMALQTSNLWRVLESSKVLSMSQYKLMTMLIKALIERQQQQRRCKFCQHSFPPEFIETFPDEESKRPRKKWVCHVCMERHMGVAF